MQFSFAIHLRKITSPLKGRNYYSVVGKILDAFQQSYEGTDSGFIVYEDGEFGLKSQPDFTTTIINLAHRLSEAEIYCATINVPVGFWDMASHGGQSTNQKLSYSVDHSYTYTHLTFYFGVDLSLEEKLAAFQKVAVDFLNLVYLMKLNKEADQLLGNKQYEAVVERLDRTKKLIGKIARRF